MDIETLLAPVSDDTPCGQADIDYDPRYSEMERAAKGKAEQQMGDAVSAGEPPDWKSVARLAKELLGQSKDLRLLMYLGRAQLNIEGLGSFAVVLQATEKLLNEHWDGLYPELDEDDNNDPTLRVNSLLSLKDVNGVLEDVSRSPLVSVRGIGTFSQHDIRVALGEIPGDEDAAPIGLIDEAFANAPIEELQSVLEGIQQVRGTAASIESLLTEKVGAGNSIDLSPLTSMLGEPERIIAEKLTSRGVDAEVGGSEGDSSIDEGEAAAEHAVAAPRPPEGINNRDDVVRAINKICEFYAKQEPSSPVPLLLKRAERLVHMSFMDIIRDVAPDGMTNVERIAGENND